jgi:hypothetical protein
MKRLFISLLALSAVCAGCVSPDPFSAEAQWNLDKRKEADGTLLVLDTPGNWRAISSAIRAEVRREASGMDPPGNVTSWTQYWRSGFSRLRKNQEHPERYFALVLDLRRMSDLPDLPREAIAE